MDLIECGKLNRKEIIRKFILASQAPVDISSKLSASYNLLAEKEKEIARELREASKFCETISFDLISIIAGSKNIELLLKSVDQNGVHFVDVLVNCNLKSVVSHFAVQQYFSDLWVSNLKMGSINLFLIFLCIFFCPIIWLVLSLPIPLRLSKNGRIINNMPIIKFMCHCVSHLYFIILLFLTCVLPLTPITSMNTSITFPNYHEWILLAWISGQLAAELSNPCDKGGLGSLKIVGMILTTIACIIHLISFFFDSNDLTRYDILFARNIIFAFAALVASVQILDLLTFHYLFGPWAIIIRTLMIDLFKFLVILAIFLFGFTCVVTAVYQDVYPDPNDLSEASGGNDGLKNPLTTIEMLFFALFGLVDPLDMPTLSRLVN
jgi:hypothetical protein